MRICYNWSISQTVQQALSFLAGLDIRGIAQNVMGELFRQLAMRYDFSPDGLLPPERVKETRTPRAAHG